MTFEPCNPDLIEAFYRAYNDTSGSQQQRLGRCQQIVEALRDCGKADGAYLAWSLLFDGILANERERDWGQGERLMRAALAASQGRDRLLEARACLALAVTCHTLDRWSEAIAFGRQALDALAGLDKPIDEASAWTNMAIACSMGYTAGAFDARRLVEGIGYCQQALAVLETAPADRERASLEAFAYNTLGSLDYWAGRWHDALAAYQHHFTICQEAGYVCRAGISLGNQGEVYEQLGPDYYPQALAAHRAALAIHQGCQDTFQVFHSHLQLASLSQASGDSQGALDHFLQAIALVEEIRQGISTADARAGFFATVANAYTHATLLAAALGQTATAFDLAERSRARAFLDSLAAGSADLARHSEAAPLSLDEIRAALPADAALIEYVTSGLIEAPERRRRATANEQPGRMQPATTLLFAATREQIEIHDLHLSPNDVLPRQLRSASERHFLSASVRRTLYECLISPIAPLLAGKRRIYIVPHGPLHYVPFQALLAPDGETLLRPGGPELVYGPSASVLFGRPSRLPKTSQVSELPCLALGFDGEGGQRLRFAAEEAGRVAALLGGEALLGPARKRAALFQRGPAARFLHISCHGQFDPDAPLESFLHLGASETLTARDVLDSLRLSCDLVTLSACESGLSLVRRGDELMGLVRAFMAAGAPAVLATLWRVDERSTRLLMERFYREALDGASFAQALHTAQLYLRNLSRTEAVELLGGDADIASVPDKPFADPFYWAPFVLIGGQSPPIDER
ncbi:MAG: CHAT domain-containing protein [Anaerolineae bacterium]